MTELRAWRAGVGVLLGAWGVGGCAGGGAKSPEFEVPAGQYARAFDEARDVLASYRFELERVDAADGVIATVPKTTAGLATPWDQEQTTFEQGLGDLVNRQQRTARITFETQGADPRAATGPVHGRVEVVIERTRRPGWRLDTTSLRYGSFTRDPALEERGMWPKFTVAVAQDPLLAGRLAADIRKRLGLAEPGERPKAPAPRPRGEPPL
jgi:hypothetical protein